MLRMVKYTIYYCLKHDICSLKSLGLRTPTHQQFLLHVAWVLLQTSLHVMANATQVEMSTISIVRDQ